MTKATWRKTDHGDKRHREFAIMCDSGGNDGEGGKVASVYAGFGHHFTFEEAEKHASLIAAAPDMLAALHVALTWVGRAPRKEDMAQYSAARKLILDAISKTNPATH